MPMAPPRACVRCGRSGCQCASTAKEQRRGPSSSRGYDYAWAQYSKAWRRKHPICGERADGQVYAQHSLCVRNGFMRPAEVVDHIVPMSQGGSKWAPENHQSLCLSCNTAKGDR